MIIVFDLLGDVRLDARVVGFLFFLEMVHVEEVVPEVVLVEDVVLKAYLRPVNLRKYKIKSKRLVTSYLVRPQIKQLNCLSLSCTFFLSLISI